MTDKAKKIMARKGILILGILLLCQVIQISVVQAQSVYHNDEGHFSFILPKDWEELPQGTIDYISNQARQAGGNANYITMFQKNSNGRNSRIEIAISKCGKLTDKAIRELLNGKDAQAQWQKIGKDMYNKFPPSMAKDFDWGKWAFDKDRNVLFVKSKESTPNGTTCTVTANILSSFGFITMTFHVFDDTFDSLLNDYNQIIDSFEFDKAYRY